MKELVKTVPILHILESMGYEMKGRKGMYLSPFRNEAAPSFHIDSRLNVWYDFGRGEGGDNIRLVQLLKGCGFKEAINFISGVRGSCHASLAGPENIHPKIIKSSLVPVLVTDLNNPALLDYAASRGIPSDILKQFCRQVHYRNLNNGREYFAIGFPNNNSGYVLRSACFKGTSKGGITTLAPDGSMIQRPMSEITLVFEGFFNFLSYLAIKKKILPGDDVLVMNSIGNIKASLPWISSHKEAECYLDNDAPGKKTLDSIVARCPGVEVGDHSIEYGGFNDLNDYLKSMLDSGQEIKQTDNSLSRHIGL